MNVADWFALVIVVLTALSGIRRGLVTGVLSLVGLVAGAVLGARIAPGLLGDASRYVPLVTLGGAAIGGGLGQALGGLAGRWARRSLSVVPPLRMLDSAGGVVLGAVTGLAFCWAIGAVLLYAPGQTELRRLAQESTVVSTLTEALPPERVMDAIGRIDTFSSIVGPSAGVDAPEPAVARRPAVRAARGSVVRVRGAACGLGVEGSGWIVASGLVVTNAHVVAGVHRPVVDRRDGRTRIATVVSFDATNDIAILRVPDLDGRPLLRGEPETGGPAALLGFPHNGPYVVTPVRVGRTVPVATRDAYGRGLVGRRVVGIRGDVRSGNSGGPVVDPAGRVVGTVFAQRRGGVDEGYAVPNEIVADALENAGPALETACVMR